MGISIGMVGLGAFGRGFVDLFKAHPGVDRIAFCDMEKNRVEQFAADPFMAGKFNSRDMYCTLDDICRSDLDALVIITQPWLHAPQCIQALESGKHVFSAVPIIQVPDSAEILDWCDKLVDAVRRTGRRYMLAETSYYHPEAMFMRRMAAEGRFGKFIMAEGEYCHDYISGRLRQVQMRRTASMIGSQWPRTMKERYIDKGIWSGPMHYPTHSIGAAFPCMKTRALKVSARGTPPCGYDSYFDDVAENFGNETATFELANGAVFVSREYREVAAEGYDAKVYGTEGSYYGGTWHERPRTRNMAMDDVPKLTAIQYSSAEMRDKLPREVELGMIRAQNKTLDNVENIDFTPKGHGGSHPYLVHEFVDAVTRNRHPAINVWEAAHYVAMGAVAHQSALKDGERLAVPDWGFAPDQVGS